MRQGILQHFILHYNSRTKSHNDNDNDDKKVMEKKNLTVFRIERAWKKRKIQNEWTQNFETNEIPHLLGLMHKTNIYH